jgi:hypothetical protein
LRDEYYIQYYFPWNNTSRFYLVPEVEAILTLVAVEVVVIVAVVEIISMRVVVAVEEAVEEGGDYLDTSSSSKSIGGPPAWSLSCGQLTVL